jgi:hypothetical protein
VLSVPFPQHGGFPSGKLRPGVLVNRLQHHESRLAFRPFATMKQPVVDQLVDTTEHVESSVDIVDIDYCFRRLERAPAGRNGQLPKRCSSGSVVRLLCSSPL